MNPIARHPMSRRAFLHRSALGVGGLAVGSVLAAACGSDKQQAASGTTATAVAGTAAPVGSTASASPDLGHLSVQLNWIADPEFSGSYLAEKNGYYKAAGFSSVAFVSGGPNVEAEASIVAGKGLYGYATSEGVAGAVAHGAPLRIIGVDFQQNPYCIASLPSRPIRTAADLVGKRIGVQSANGALWNALLKVLKLKPSQITEVPAQNDPAPLVAGEVDGFLSFVSNQPITLRAEGHNPVILPLTELGFVLYEQLFATTQDVIDKHRDELVAGMAAEVRGAKAFVANPASGVATTLAKGASLKFDPKVIAAEAQAIIGLMQSEWTKAHGLLTFDPAMVAKNQATLNTLGLTLPDGIYVPDILDEVYSKHLGG